VTAQQAKKSAWKTDAAGRTTFRLMPPLVLWWVWVAFAAGNLIDLAVQSRTWFALEITFVLLVVTGFMYACALRPRVIADAAGLTIRNPFREYRVPWGGVAGVFLGDSVEIQCEQDPPRPVKTIYSWALYSPRRARARAELRASTGLRRQRYDARSQRRYGVSESAPQGYGKLPAQAQTLSRQHPSHVMAGELGRRCSEAQAAAAQAGGAPEGRLTGRWAWLPIAAVVIPVAGLIALILAR
jgi:hypothetical protein